MMVDRIADLTGLRDREQLDAAFVALICDLVPAQSVAVLHLIGDESDRRWLTRARLEAGQAVPQSDPPWIDLRALPGWGERPGWDRCLTSGRMQPWRALDGCSTWRLGGAGSAVGVVEVRSLAPLDAQAVQTVDGVLRIYCNLLALLDYSECDTLTGLLNRKSFDESFYKASALPLARSLQGPTDRRQVAGDLQYWLGVVDVDHFKQVNDRFGHLIGDEVLLLLSRQMRQSFRFYDQLYRFGGEEFVVLLRCTGEQDAMAAMQRFRESVRAFSFPQAGQVTVSVGFTDVRIGDTPQAAVDRADRAVYMAKSLGRDQVCSFAALVEAGLLVEASKVGDVEFF